MLKALSGASSWFVCWATVGTQKSWSDSHCALHMNTTLNQTWPDLWPLMEQRSHLTGWHCNNASTSSSLGCYTPLCLFLMLFFLCSDSFMFESSWKHVRQKTLPVLQAVSCSSPDVAWSAAWLQTEPAQTKVFQLQCAAFEMALQPGV